MIRSHIGSTQDYRVVLKLDKISHLSCRSFGLGFPIGLEALSKLGSYFYYDDVIERGGLDL